MARVPAQIMTLIAALIVGIAPIMAAAQTPGALPPEVRAYFDKARQECRAAGDRLHVKDETSFAQTADFNGDGRPDYIVQMAELVCPALGYSEYCGSAGCLISILVSTGDRLREVTSGNYQAYAITAPVDGRQGIAIAAHGTYCGHQYGADTCFGTMRWTGTGFKTTYTTEVPAALKQMQADQAAAGKAIDPVKDPRFDWKVIGPAPGKPGATIAISEGSADRPRVVVACAEGVPALVMAFPPGAKAPPVGVHLMVELGDPVQGRPHADVILQPVQDKPAYIGRLTPAALAILRSAAQQSYPSISASWTLKDRDYWIDMPALPLTRFNDAAGPVLSRCT